MAKGASSALIPLRREPKSPTRYEEMRDGLLLSRFLNERDEAAFEALMARHGPMVLGVCRQVLNDAEEAEDAFQVTFLVLVRKADTIRKRDWLGSWLYGVAYRVAVRAKANTVQRRVHERQGATVMQSDPMHDVPDPDLESVLHEELNRLPEKYRTPVVLCYLEGQTQEQAAQRLQWPIGTVKGRLARARGLLRTRLSRRGLALSTGFFATALSQSASAVPTHLIDATVRAAVQVAAGEVGIASLGSARLAAWTEEALTTESALPLPKAVTALLAVIILASVGWLANRLLDDKLGSSATAAAKPLAASGRGPNQTSQDDVRDSGESTAPGSCAHQ